MPDPFPRPHLPAQIDLRGCEVVQVILPAEMADSVQSYLRGRDCYLEPVPTSDDDLPTFTVGVSTRLVSHARR